MERGEVVRVPVSCWRWEMENLLSNLGGRIPWPLNMRWNMMRETVTVRSHIPKTRSPSPSPMHCMNVVDTSFILNVAYS